MLYIITPELVTYSLYLLSNDLSFSYPNLW